MWELLQPVVGHPIITVLLDAFYHKGWTLMSIGVLALVIVSPTSPLRRRYITASALLLFLVGTLSALALSSAGPPYYDQVVHGPDPYAPLFAYLSSVGKHATLISSEGRDVLWTAYRHRVDAFGFGISAMPSMHVATAALATCLAFAIGPWLGLTALLCTIVVAVASVSLGWHYALDGYVGAILAIAVWWIAGRIEREVPETAPETAAKRAPATVPELQPVAVWVPPSRRRAAATLPVRAAAVASADDAAPRASSVAQRPRPVRTS
jgi:membrane-associated phospholipid phosphatase